MGQTPPKDRRNKDCKGNQKESSAHKKAPSHHDSTWDHNKDAKIGDLKIEELKRLIAQMNSEKSTLNPVAAISPFTKEIRTDPLPAMFRSNHSLTYNGGTDPAEFLIRFNIEMKVYQVSMPAKCRLFAASMRGSAQQWFSKLGEHITIDFWEQFAHIFLKQFQSSMIYAPPVSILASIRQKDGKTL